MKIKKLDLQALKKIECSTNNEEEKNEDLEIDIFEA